MDRQPYQPAPVKQEWRLPQNARSRRVAERFGLAADGQMEVVGLVFDRYVWPLAAGDATRP
jgi:hypothetical protein